jgi:hypothetical protein
MDRLNVVQGNWRVIEELLERGELIEIVFLGAARFAR